MTYFLAIATSLGSLSFCPLVSGEYVSTAMPLSLQNDVRLSKVRYGVNSTWLTVERVEKNMKTRVLWNTYPVRCCCMKFSSCYAMLMLCETQLIAEEDYKFARTHTFALLTMVIALCTIKHL